jgi:hypothetical protein
MLLAFLNLNRRIEKRRLRKFWQPDEETVQEDWCRTRADQR